MARISLAGVLYGETTGQFKIIIDSNDSGTNQFSSTGTIHCMDVDNVNAHIYWGERTQANGLIVVKFDGVATTLVSITNQPGDEVNGIAVDPVGNKVYWARGFDLFRADLNGANGEIIATTVIGGILDIVLDRVNNRIFICGDAESDSNGFVQSFDLDGSNSTTHTSGNIDRKYVAIAVAPLNNFFYVATEGPGQDTQVRRQEIQGGSGTPVLIDETYGFLPRDITIDDEEEHFYIVDDSGLYRQNLDGSNKIEFVDDEYTNITTIPCEGCEFDHILVPTSTTNSLNFFGTPFQDANNLHLNIDVVGLCLAVIDTDHLTGNDDASRIKVGFTLPDLKGTNTFYGIFGNICGAFSDFTLLNIEALGHPGHVNFNGIGAELFLEGIPLKKLIFTFPSPTGSPTGTIGGYSWYDPDLVGDLAFHEAIITAGLDPYAVDWSTLEVQITIDDEMGPGVSFVINWLAITVFEKAIPPTALGGVDGGGIAQESVVLSIKGGAVASGEALISGPVVEEGLGGIVISPKHLIQTIETRFTFGGAVVPKTVVFVDFIKHFIEFPTDTKCFLSGGSTNGDPLLSIGGEVSFVEAEGDLFDDFQPEESTTGLEDYRCIYIFNNTILTLTSLKIWTEVSPLSSAAITLGLRQSNDVQEVNLSFAPTSGSFTLDFGGTNVVVNATPALDIFAQNFQDALRNTSLTDVIVQVQLLGTTVNFVVTFAGGDGSREHPTFALLDNSLSGNPILSIVKTDIGSPINAVAQSIATDTTAPDAEFKETTEILPIVVPILNENEGFPLWIKRIISANPVATQNDGFILRINANPSAIA